MMASSFGVLALAAVLTLFAIGTVFFILYAVVIGSLMGAPYVRSKKEKIARMLAYARITPEDRVVDLGSGDGSLVIAAAAAGAGAVIGVEMNPLLVWYSRIRIRRAGFQGRARIIRGNFYTTPLRSTDVLMLYLWPSTLDNLREKMERELEAGSRVVSNAFPVAGWTPVRHEDGVFVYHISHREIS